MDTLLRSDTPAGQRLHKPAESRGELARILTTSFHNGSDFNPADRAYAAKVVSAQTGLSQADADKRVKLFSCTAEQLQRLTADVPESREPRQRQKLGLDDPEWSLHD